MCFIWILFFAINALALQLNGRKKVVEYFKIRLGNREKIASSKPKNWKIWTPFMTSKNEMLFASSNIEDAQDNDPKYTETQ